MKNVPAVFGEVLYDCFEDGSRVLGGAPFNVAWHLQAFGCSPRFISRVGDDAMGHAIREDMQRWGMNTDWLQQDASHPTGEVRVTLVDGQPEYDIVSGRAYDYIDADAIPALSPSVIYQGTLGLRQPESAAALEALLARHPAPVFLDVNLRPPWWDMALVRRQLDHAQWVKINDEELQTVMEGDADLKAMASALMERHGLERVIVTLGANGAFALDDRGELTESDPMARVPVVDTVGAGDAFASVCILGMLHDWPLSSIMDRAQRFASLIVGQRGATLQDKTAYRPLLNDWQLDAQPETEA
ncbi:MAG: carbohydrate kinase [Gammaproteobacteria bacterium]|nr:carbohydrate kinase [Gammaproteobacteria bacterium]